MEGGNQSQITRHGGFRVNAKLRKKLRARKQRVDNRMDKANWSGQTPMISTPKIRYEMAEKQQAISAGGVGTMMQLIQRLDLRTQINQAIPLLKFHMPYDEADHVFNMAAFHAANAAAKN